VTVLFCDLANSTPIAERLGPEHMHTLLNRFFELALSEVHRYEGTINQFLGDGFMALFGAPLAHEDHARRGVLAALALQHALQGAELGQAYGVECAFRMGLNSGLVVVGSIGDNLRMDYSAIGDTTNLAARLQQLAEPGTILVSESTTRLVQDAVRLEALAPVEVKGKTEPVSIYKVIGAPPRRSPIVSRSERTLSPFVGRERELATLEALFTQVESGQGQVLGVVAEAGGGKSRLLYEFRQRLQDKRVTYLEGRCLSYGIDVQVCFWKLMRLAGGPSHFLRSSAQTALRPRRHA
jgi:class 3 adenylate cyclase